MNASLKDILIFSILIFFIILFLIIAIRAIFAFILNRTYKKYKSIKNATKNIIRPSKKYLKEEEELFLFKNQIPKAHSVKKEEIRRQKESNSIEDGSYEIIESEEQRLDKEKMSQVEIVDIVKPIGFWTSLILGEKLTYLIQSAQVLNKRGNKGFWVSMVEAKDRINNRQRGRGL